MITIKEILEDALAGVETQLGWLDEDIEGLRKRLEQQENLRIERISTRDEIRSFLEGLG